MKKTILISIWLAGSVYTLVANEPPAIMPEMEVTAEGRLREIFEQPRVVQPSLEISQSIVTWEEMERQGARVLSEAVRYQPGLWSETRGRKVKEFISFRGQVYPYPDYAWNGLWLPEFHEMPYLFPAIALERVEVIRSSASLFMGITGDVGVFNLVPRAPEGPARMMLRGGSYGTAEAAVFAPLSSDPGGLAAAAGYYHTDGPSGRHAEENLLHGMLTGEHAIGDNAVISYQFLGLQSDRELMQAKPPAGQRLQTTQERYEPFQAVLSGVRLNVAHDDDAVTSAGIGAAYRYNDFINEGAGGHVSMREKDYSITMDVTHARLLTDANRLRIGAVYNHYAAPDGKRFIEGRRVDYDTMALIVSDEHQIGNVLLDAGVRVSRRYLRDYAGFSVGGSSRGLEGVDGVKNEWEKPVVRMTAGARWMATAQYEVFTHGGVDRIRPRSGTLDVNLEEPDNETRLNGELGMRYSLVNGAVLESTAFAVLRNDGLVLDGATEFTPAGREMELYRNQDLRQTGIEAGVRQVPVLPGTRLFANIVYIQSDAKDDNGSYSRNIEIPQLIASAGIDADIGANRLGAYVKHVSDYKSRRFAGDGEYHPLGDFTDLRVRLTRFFSDNLSITASIDNLLDDEYSTTVGYPDTGIKYWIQLDKLF